MCCEAEAKETKTVPDYIKQAGQEAISAAKALDWKGEPLEIAGFSDDQRSAFQQVRDLASKPGISTESLVDEGGRLGPISKYMNPSLDAALSPTLRAIQEAEDANRKRIGAGATSAEAYGDARHGIQEVGNMQSAQTARREAAGSLYSRAFETAMQMRGVDLSRFSDIDKTNFMQTLQAASALLSTGGQQQGLDQAKNQAVLDQFLRKYGANKDMVNALIAALGQPYETTTTTTQPDNSILEVLGGVAAKAAPALILSDVRLKRNIRRLGAMPSGLPVYCFQYLWDDVCHIGVMAQEARGIFPEAVFMGPGGYLMVDYARIA